MATRDVELTDSNSEASDKVSLTANDKGPILDKLIVAVVVIGIIVFAAFQISESVTAHENPATKSTVEVVPRTYPGLMICPYSQNHGLPVFGQPPACPKWSPDAILQYISPNIQFDFVNSNLHTASQRTRTRCPLNHVAAVRVSGGDDLLFGHFPSRLVRGSETLFNQKVIVKNSAKPKLTCEQNSELTGCQNPQDAVTFPYLCPSFTPPNVQCIVFDPNYFDTQAKIYGMDPICNPMKEVVANTADSVTLSLKSFFSLDFPGPEGYKYSGLLPQPNLPDSNMFKGLPTENFLNPLSLDKLKDEGGFNPYASLFAGVVAVFYDPAKGIPTTLDFDNAQDSSMSEEILSSSVLFRTNCDYFNQRKPCPQKLFSPLRVSIANEIERTLPNKMSSRLINRTFYSSNIQPATDEQKADLRMVFTSSSTVVNTQIISLSILTTVSIILSTAATLWGSQDKIKAGIVLFKEKFDAYKKAK
jgi:hypothetical protein